MIVLNIFNNYIHKVDWKRLGIANKITLGKDDNIYLIIQTFSISLLYRNISSLYTLETSALEESH